MNWQKIILYRRFSSLKQGNGSSLQRQLELATAFCQDRGWTIDEVLTDEGKSAFHGNHRNGGLLGTFEHEAAEGQHRGVLLVVENLDRLSREKVKTSFSFISRLLEVGVTILTYDDGKFYDENADMVDLIVMLTILHRGNGESETKSKRSKANWSIKHKRAVKEGRAPSKRCHPWLKVVDGSYVLHEDRTPLLNRIFVQADAGSGSLALTRELNRTERPWNGKCWHRSFVIRLLTNRAVIGEAIIQGEPVKLYPAAITADLFERVSGNAEARKASMGGRKSAKVNNLLSGLCRCEACNGRMEYVGAGQLRCRSNMTHMGCTNSVSVSYAKLEQAVLDSCLHLALDDNAFTNRAEVVRLNTTIAERQNDLQAAQDKTVRMMDLYNTQGSKVAMTMALEAEQAAEALLANLKALKKQRERAKGRASNLEHMQRVADMRKHLATDVTLRKRVAQGFQSLITQAWFAQDGTVTLMLAGGMKAIQIRDGEVVKQADMAEVVAMNVSRMNYAGARDRKAAPAVLKRVLDRKRAS